MRTMAVWADLEVFEDGGRYFAVYDAGSHQVAWRKDEISVVDAQLAATGREGALEMLWRLQGRLIKEGVDPYRSNFIRP